MTLPIDNRDRYRTSPDYWCDEHEPWEGESGMSGKLPVHFDLIEKFPFYEGGQKAIFMQVRKALGIKKGTRINEEMAKRFFAKLSR